MSSLRAHALLIVSSTACNGGPHIPTERLVPSCDGSPTTIDNRVRFVCDFMDRDIVTGAYLDLDDDDRLEVAFRDATVALERHQSNNVIDYVADVPFDPPLAEDEVFTLSLLRDTEADAPASTVTIPPGLTLNTINAPVSRSADFTFNWSPVAEDMMRWNVFACVAGNGLIDTDTGAETIPANTLVPSEPTSTCMLTLVVLRQRLGALDPAFAPGSIVFDVGDNTDFTSTP